MLFQRVMVSEREHVLLLRAVMLSLGAAVLVLREQGDLLVEAMLLLLEAVLLFRAQGVLVCAQRVIGTRDGVFEQGMWISALWGAWWRRRARAPGGALADAALAALDEQAAARAAARAAEDRDEQCAASLGAMSEAGSDVIAAIKAKVASSGSGIWTLADLPEPSTPSPIPAPGMPTDFVAELIQSGALKISWKCPNPTHSQGTVYEVARKVGSAGALQILGTTGKKSFVDNTLTTAALASGSVVYQITAVRSTLAGTPGRFWSSSASTAAAR
jgi:hypothetical protein